jgi:hypothetical protein
MNAVDFANSVMTLALKWNLSVTSWGRTRNRNSAVGGVDNSYHILWLGCDVVFDGVMQKDLAFEKDASFVGLQALWEANHYHLQPK